MSCPELHSTETQDLDFMAPKSFESLLIELAVCVLIRFSSLQSLRGLRNVGARTEKVGRAGFESRLHWLGHLRKIPSI